MAKLFSGLTCLRRFNSETNQAEAASADELKGKVVLLFFSARWCPPCRKFTPKLKALYDILKPTGQLEVIVVSADQDESEMMGYFKEAHGGWMFIEHGDPMIQHLDEDYGVVGIPELIPIKPDGTHIEYKSCTNQDLRHDIEKDLTPPTELLAILLLQCYSKMK